MELKATLKAIAASEAALPTASDDLSDSADPGSEGGPPSCKGDWGPNLKVKKVCPFLLGKENETARAHMPRQGEIHAVYFTFSCFNEPPRTRGGAPLTCLGSPLLSFLVFLFFPSLPLPLYPLPPTKVLSRHPLDSPLRARLLASLRALCVAFDHLSLSQQVRTRGIDEKRARTVAL